MAYDPGAIDATLAAAVGDEPLLIADLRAAFLLSARRGLEAMEQAGTASEWTVAASRLKGLAASFGAVRLMAATAEAASAPLRDPATLRRLRRSIDRL